jgi:hypothetical protein
LDIDESLIQKPEMLSEILKAKEYYENLLRGLK